LTCPRTDTTHTASSARAASHPLGERDGLPGLRDSSLGKQAKAGVLTITHTKMNRFWITLDQACEFLWNKLKSMEDGEVLIHKVKSCSMNTLAVVIGKSVRSNPEFRMIGVR
jgi:UDP-N-acetylglucosamine 4,6-dehydratase